MSGSSASSKRDSGLALGMLVVGVVVWLWPIGFGGRMPVGGDVTQFSMGLMAFLQESLRSLRLPVWNDLWGYGFPGLAESQMGVYYPPHWLLYGLLPLEWAYTASLVVHTLFGALGAYWCSRRFEVTPIGSALAGFAWTASGFFVIHLPHQWGYTVGCWMPWAWGLTWQIVQRNGSGRTPYLLALVLALQVLPGHFQLAFCTEVGVLLLVVGGVRWRESGPRPGLVVALALVAAAPLATMQLVPTLRLAVMAAGHRDYGYLSGFAATPLHLVSYVAPGLFQRSPLWRPLAWDPFHTSPEEHLAYIGLVPLFLAVGGIVRGVRKDPAVRALTLVALATLVFSLGPYFPGFEVWRRLPGFSFFRAPARWSVATGLALSLLAGIGFDASRSWTRPGRSIAWFAIAALLAPAVVVLAVELALASTEPTGWPAVAGAYDKALNQLPWASVDSDAPSIRELAAIARQPQDDALLRVRVGLARQGIAWQTANRTFAKARFAIYRAELGETAILIVALLVLALVARNRRCFAVGLIALAAIDLWVVGHHRRFDLGPIRSLNQQSPVLARLQRLGRGARTVDGARNLPMVAGAAPVSSYRTLDLPCLVGLTAATQAPPGHEQSAPVIAGALRAAGASARVLGPFETTAVTRAKQLFPGWTARENVRDRALAGWLFGVDWVAEQGAAASTFTLVAPSTLASQAWLVPLTTERAATMLEVRSSQVESVLASLRRAAPLELRRSRPERLEVQVDATRPSLVLLSQLADPQWRAHWEGPGGRRDAAIVPAFAGRQDIGWQAVELPGPGRWTLTMEYDARDVQAGLAVSLASWAVWAVAFVRRGRSADPLRGNPS